MNKINFYYYILTLIFFLLHFPSTVSGQNSFQDLGYFHDIINVHEVDSGTIAIVSNGGSHHVTIFSTDEKRTAGSFIRNGRGPGEIMQAEASSLEHTDDGTVLHIKDFAGKLVSLNLTTEQIVTEIQTTFIHTSNLDKIDGHFLLSRRIVLPAAHISIENEIDVGYIVEDETFQVTDTLRVPVKKLDISETNNLNRLNEGTHIRLDTYVVALSNDTYLLGVQGNSSIFYFSKGEVSDRIVLNTDSTGKIEVVRNDAYGYGLRIPGLLNNIYHVNRDENTVHFSSDQQAIGNSPQIVSVSHSQKGLSVEYKRVDGVDHLSYRLMMYKIGDGFVVHDRAVNQSSNLYLLN